MKKLGLALGAMFLSSMALANEANVSVSYRMERVVPILHISAEENNVTIQNVIVNRGNCKVQNPPYEQSDTLNFGEDKKFYVESFCNIKEVQVMTNYGTSVFTFR